MARSIRVPYLRSLRLRALIVALATLALPPAFVLAWLWAERGYESGMEANAEFGAAEARELLLRVRQLPPGSAGDTGCGRYALAEGEPLRKVAEGHRVRLKLLDRDGRECFAHDADDYVDWSQRAGSVVFGSRTSTPPAERPPEVAGKELVNAREAGSTTSCGETPARDALECHALIALDDQTFLFVQDSAWRPASILSELERPLIRLTLLATPFAIALAWLLSRRLVRPIERLREQVVSKAQAASAAPNLSALGGDEVDHLTESFNALLRSLQERREAESMIAADLVHELKNPLASIRAAGEALQKPTMDEQRRTQLGRVLEQSSARLLALATEYLEIARAEARLPGELREPVDVAELARGICRRIADDARFAGIALTAFAEQPAIALGIPHRIESVLSNLIENAALASSPAGSVRVEVETRGDRIEVRVVDSGPGIPQDELGRLFQRFHTTRRESGGTGLGLASSRAVIEAHSGGLSARNLPGGGACFEAWLPVA